MLRKFKKLWPPLKGVLAVVCSGLLVGLLNIAYDYFNPPDLKPVVAVVRPDPEYPSWLPSGHDVTDSGGVAQTEAGRITRLAKELKEVAVAAKNLDEATLYFDGAEALF